MRLAVPAVLLIIFAVLIAGCGGGGTTTVIERTVTEKVETPPQGEEGGGTTASESGSGRAEDKIEAPTAVVHDADFRSPTGNIGCQMIAGGVRCDIRKRDWSPPPRPARCPDEVDFGQGLAVSRDGKAAFVCAGDTVLDPSAPVLGYGEASELAGTQCISRKEGVTCANHAGHGFFISIQSYKKF